MNILRMPALTRAAIVLAVGAAPIVLAAQIPTDAWPTYNGDYSGRRYSTLKQVSTANVKSLTLAWVYRLNTSRSLIPRAERARPRPSTASERRACNLHVLVPRPRTTHRPERARGRAPRF